MRVGDALLLGVMQGLTEFLPVSSSAHLALIRRVRGIAASGATDVALHAGSTAALLLALHGDLIGLITPPGGNRGGVPRFGQAYRQPLVRTVAQATVPTVIVGTLIHRKWVDWNRSPRRLAAGLLLGSVPMVVAEWPGAGRAHFASEHLPVREATLLGFAQSLALVPGVSRSGVTIAVATLCGLDMARATKLSFLLAVPVTVAAAVREVPEIRRMIERTGATPIAAGAGAAFLSGLAGVTLMRRWTRRHGLRPFVAYRMILALVLFLVPQSDAAPTLPVRPTFRRPGSGR